ncbi:MAG: CoA pyrophosphatase [Bdellovibrionota bacterium]|nr:hypothetical protein [Pseudobdellovibrionaceae bacterium]|tara:strand:- start:62652 stop:63314 length:663 start_codon:yes stop_codon:yes gene_type:complete
MINHITALTPLLKDHAAFKFDKRAAVSAVVYVDDNPNAIPEVFYMKRAENPEDRWAGQIGFPGGKKEGNESDLETAERETLEEVGFDPNVDGSFWGALNSVEARKGGSRLGFGIYPFLYRVSQKPQIIPDPAEVADTYWVPLDVILDPSNDTDKTIQHNGMNIDLPGIQFPEGNILWGLTYKITYDLVMRIEQTGYLEHLRKITGNSKLGTEHLREYLGR